MWSSDAFAIVAVMPCEFGAPAGPGIRLIVGESLNCEISRNAVNRESPARSPSSWLPHVSTSPPMLQTRAADVGDPQRSLYVRFDSASMCMYSPGGLPVERQILVTGFGVGNRLSIWFTPFSEPSKSPMTTSPAPMLMVTSSSSTAPRENDEEPELRESESANPRFVLTRNTRRTLPETPPRIVEIVADGTTIGPADGVASSVSVGLFPVFWKISK